MRTETTEEVYASSISPIILQAALTAAAAGASVYASLLLLYTPLHGFAAGAAAGISAALSIWFFIRRGYVRASVSGDVVSIARPGSERTTLSRSESIFSARLRRRLWVIITLWTDRYLVVRDHCGIREFLLPGFSRETFGCLMTALQRRGSSAAGELPAAEIVLEVPKEKMLRECRRVLWMFAILSGLSAGAAAGFLRFFYPGLFEPFSALLFGGLCGLVPFLGFCLAAAENFRKEEDIPTRITVTAEALQADDAVYFWTEMKGVAVTPPAAAGKDGAGDRIVCIDAGPAGRQSYSLGPCAPRGTLQTIFAEYALLYAALEKMSAEYGFLLTSVDPDAD